MASVKILIVEDDPSIRELLRVLLESEGYAIDEAGDGGEGLEKARGVQPHLMILDLMMPGVDGEQVIGTMRGAPSLAHIPVIVVTGKDEALGRVKDLLGDENVFSKPFEPTRLLDRVGALVDAGPGWR